jgi:hypothetical protein
MLLFRRSASLILLLVMISIWSPARVHALIEPYQSTELISDAEFSDASALSCEQIQLFLDKKPGILKNLVENEQPASQHICKAAAEFDINPRLMLVMMQKEMRMITDPAPDGDQINWSAGCGPGWESTRGFANQMRCVAKTLRRNFDRPYVSGSIDGVIPVNQGTLALYRYTNHVDGNRLFWMIWQGWWPNSTNSSSAAGMSSLDGTVIVDSRDVELTPKPIGNAAPLCKSGWATTATGGNSHHWLTPSVSTLNESTNFAIWRPNLPAAGRYQVYAFIPSHIGRVPWACGQMPARNDTTNAIYIVQHRDGISRVAINQAPHFDEWVDLGAYTFGAGSSSYVLVSDLTGEPSNSSWVNIDEMKFVPKR